MIVLEGPAGVYLLRPPNREMMIVGAAWPYGSVFFLLLLSSLEDGRASPRGDNVGGLVWQRCSRLLVNALGARYSASPESQLPILGRGARHFPAAGDITVCRGSRYPRFGMGLQFLFLVLLVFVV
jgi:hypothetical protein